MDTERQKAAQIQRLSVLCCPMFRYRPRDGMITRPRSRTKVFKYINVTSERRPYAPHRSEMGKKSSVAAEIKPLIQDQGYDYVRLGPGHLIEKIIENESARPYSKQSAMAPYLEPDQSKLHLHKIFLWNTFWRYHPL